MEGTTPSGGQIAVLANAIAVTVAEGLSPEQQNIVGNLLTLVGASILSVAAIAQASSQAGSTQAR